MLNMATTVLFLDDMLARHKAFMANTPVDQELNVHACFTAADAIRDLQDPSDIDQVFLDHDLSEDDIMSVPGAPTKVATGMAVVDHIMTMATPPREIFVHTCNPAAAVAMVQRLAGHPARPIVRALPFPQLINFMKLANKGKED